MTKTTKGPQAMDLPIDGSTWVPADEGVEVLDLTNARFETTADWGRDETPTKKEQPYERWLREQQDVGGTATAATDMSEDDMLYERFAEQSGLHDFIGRTPATGATADLSAPAEDGRVETPGTVDASEEDAMWNAFVEQSGASWMFGAATDGKTADLSEVGQDPGLPRELAEAEELNDALRRQSHEDHFGEQPSVSDDEMWNAYRDALGLGQ